MRYLHWTSRRLGALFASIVASDHPRAAEVRAAVDPLPDPVFFRLLVAPEVFSVVAGTSGRSPDDLVDFLIGALQAERGGPGWTAVGDVEHGGSGAAPRLPGGTPVDAHSPHALRLVEPRCGPALPWDDGVEPVVEGLAEAVGVLRSTAPAAARLVKDFTRVVVLRRDGEHPDVFRSSSTNAVVGRTLLVNPHLPSVSTADLADALLHEAIHHTLYMAEIAAPMILDAPACADVRPESPWTGNTLTAHSYLHACLVWFGLLRLWERAGADGAERAARLRAGFAHDLMAPLRSVEAALDPAVPALLAEVGAAARA